MNRRLFLRGTVALAAAPAIVRAESLMKLYLPPKEIITFDSQWSQQCMRIIKNSSYGKLGRSAYHDYQIQLIERIAASLAIPVSALQEEFSPSVYSSAREMMIQTRLYRGIR